MYFCRYCFRTIINLEWGKTHMTYSLIDKTSYCEIIQNNVEYIRFACTINNYSSGQTFYTKTEEKNRTEFVVYADSDSE